MKLQHQQGKPLVSPSIARAWSSYVRVKLQHQQGKPLVSPSIARAWSSYVRVKLQQQQDKPLVSPSIATAWSSYVRVQPFPDSAIPSHSHVPPVICPPSLNIYSISSILLFTQNPLYYTLNRGPANITIPPQSH